MGEANGFLPFPKGFATQAIHHAQEPDQWDSMAVIAPLVSSSTFKQLAPGVFKKYGYSRCRNPTRDVLEKVLAKLDNCNYGLCFSSGVGTLTAVINLLSTGDHIICGDDVYGGSYELFCDVAKLGITTTFVDVKNLQQFERAINSNTKLVWIETPTNPTLKVFDIKSLAAICKKYNIILAVDNTFLTPYLQRPIALGADIVAYSLTKYMNGHSDVIMGAVTTDSEELYKRLYRIQYSMGIVPAPFDCYQVTRSLKTLPLRMQQHNKTSILVANYLERSPMVEKVLHPGIPSHPDYELTRRQTSGHSGIFSFYIKGGLDQAKQFIKALKMFTLGGSLGGPECLVEIPSLLSHSCIPKDLKKILNITDNLVRLSIGLEDAEDIIADLKQALDSVKM